MTGPAGEPTPARPGRLLALIGPGVLVAATGVGAGDLATAGLTGAKLGVAVAWAVVLGAAIKYLVNENLARWQVATGQTILEGALRRFGLGLYLVFGVYLVAFSFFVGRALISACGVTLNAMAPLGTASTAPLSPVAVYGTACSLIGLTLAWLGGFKLFERLMACAIAVMFIVVIATAALMNPDLPALARGLTWPTIPNFHGGGFAWTVGLMGGVGGTLTVICYAYWMREAGRDPNAPNAPATSVSTALRRCRIDLAVAYTLTAVFGVAMLLIAQRITVEGSGARLIASLADALGEHIAATAGERAGGIARWAFLCGAFGAVFSSLLGVWQAVPYVFADWWRLRPWGRGADRPPVSTRSGSYRLWLVLIATVPIVGVIFGTFARVQLAYAVLGAAFIPALALALLVLNRKRGPIARSGAPQLANGPVNTLLLASCVVLAVAAAVVEVIDRLG